MDEELKRARSYAFYRLAIQSYHSHLLTQLLIRKEFSENVTHKVIEECQRLGYLDDIQWIQNYIHSHQKKWGLPIILAKLRSKGIKVDQELIVVDKESETNAVLKLLTTKYRLKDMANEKEKQKVIAALLRKGFQWEVIKECLQERTFTRYEES